MIRLSPLPGERVARVASQVRGLFRQRIAISEFGLKNPKRHQGDNASDGRSGGSIVLRTSSKKRSSGKDPSIEKLPLITVLGTAWTRYLAVHSGNSVASMASARTLSFSIAN